MFPRQLYSRRIPRIIRPLRPPSKHTPTSKPRLFTNNSQLLLLTSPAVRPQLPFLHPPSTVAHPNSSNRILNAITLRHHLPRLISTERRKKFTNGLKIAATAYALLLLFYVMQQGLYQEKIERMFPTPPDWSWKSRWFLRTARALQAPEKFGEATINWPHVGAYYRELLEKLEDPEVDGKGLEDQLTDADGDGISLIEGVGKAGLDIEGMSESWKMGYFQALMGSGEAAEKLDGWLEDRNLAIASPPEYVIGPSNPNPKPAPAGITDVLHEENCGPAYKGPEVFYMKILTTNGFKTNQKLDAALAYADWLDYKGLKETAGEVYKWAMDIASSGLSVDAKDVVDPKTGVIRDNGNKNATENLLRASTAFGVHQVRAGDLASALSVFLSVLKTRRNLPVSSTDQTSISNLSLSAKSKGSDLANTISSFIFQQPYPLPVRTGDEPPTQTLSSACEEAGLMLYIGEILFASSSKDRGLSWTRDAVDLAELSLLQFEDEHRNEQASLPPSYAMEYPSSTGEGRCEDCLKSGLENWKRMVRKLVVDAQNEELESMDRVKDYWFGRGEKKVKQMQMQRRRWEAEEMILADRSKRIHNMLGDYGVSSLVDGDSMLIS